MNDWFEWNGKRCTDYGIHVTEQPAITIPAERATYTNVPGRPGSLTVLEADDVYDDMILTAECYLADPAQIPAIGRWLKGGGKSPLPIGRVAFTMPGSQIRFRLKSSSGAIARAPSP